jgi:hypothetical protein
MWATKYGITIHIDLHSTVQGTGLEGRDTNGVGKRDE